MARKIVSGWAILCLSAMVGCISAAEPPPSAVAEVVKEQPDAVDFEQQWSEAKDQYQTQLEKLRAEVFARLTTFEDKARERGDLDKVKKYKAERLAYEELDEIPSVVDRADFNRKLKSAQEELRKAHKRTQTALLKERRDTEAEELEKELKTLLLGVSGAANKQVAEVPERWHNESYGTTIYRVKDKLWVEVDNKTKEKKWDLQEVARTKGSIDLYNATRAQTWRITPKVMYLKVRNEWEWLSNGKWIAAPPK